MKGLSVMLDMGVIGESALPLREGVSQEASMQHNERRKHRVLLTVFASGMCMGLTLPQLFLTPTTLHHLLFIPVACLLLGIALLVAAIDERRRQADERTAFQKSGRHYKRWGSAVTARRS